MHYIKKFLNGIRVASPWIFLVIGLTFLLQGNFGTFEENSKWPDVYKSVGTALISGGVFAVLLKAMQLMGIFKEELEKVIYDAKFLENRKDLDEIWEKVSRALFKDKFPLISKDITNDVRKIYFPTDHVLYYDTYDQTIEIDLIDSEKQIIKVTQHSSFTILSTTKKNFNHKTTNLINFEKDKSEVSFSIIKYNVNGEAKTPTITESLQSKILKTVCEVSLSGSDSYKFETTIEKSYSLFNDNSIGVMKDFLIHDFKLKVLLSNGLKIQFNSFGTLKPFIEKTFKQKGCYEFEYKGIIYPKQGYIFYVEKK